jgi:hypothetical protein
VTQIILIDVICQTVMQVGFEPSLFCEIWGFHSG